MPPRFDFSARLRAYAEVIVQIGLNRRPGQRLFITDPYELQGLDPAAEALVGAIESITPDTIPKVIWSAPAQVRRHAEQADWRGWARVAADHAEHMHAAIRRGDALLFLPSGHPGLFSGLPEANIRELRRIGWEHFGPVAQTLMQGSTNWTAAPAPAPGWADAAYADLPAGDDRLAALWQTVFTACRANEPSPRDAWQRHLAALQKRCAALNVKKSPSLRYVGEGTDLTVTLPPAHRWCTASLRTTDGHPFVANLPTEEIFTLPHRDSAEGRVRVARPIHYAGAVIDGIELTFARGRVITASASRNQALLQALLAIDDGAARLGEVAFVPGRPIFARERRLYHHALLDENAAPHIALGEGYGFCLSRPDPAALNHSLIHVDLALDARVAIDGAELS